jgi:hypothetical protein
VRPLALVLLAALAGCGGGGAADLTGGPGDDKITGTAGADVIDARGGKDVIEGKGGDDRITGGDEADFLYGGDGNDRFLADEDDAVDVHDCGAGADVVEEPDARDQLLPNCERAGWTDRPPGVAYDNRIDVQPAISGGSAEFHLRCPRRCTGVLELRTPSDRRLLGKGRFKLAAARTDAVRAAVNARGRELIGRGGYVRVVLRSGGVNSGFTTFLHG